jgi:hypothetical protein
MSEIRDLLPIPDERDFPDAHLDARRDALVSAVRADATNEPFARRLLRAARRSWLFLFGILALGSALLTLGSSAQQRPVQREAVAALAVAGTVQIAIAVAPNVGLADGPRMGAKA